MLADAYLKGLLAAHHDGRAESAAAWTPADFVSCTEVRQTAMKHMQWACPCRASSSSMKRDRKGHRPSADGC